jgi:hypothetical protein
MRRFLIVLAVVILLLLPLAALAQSPSPATEPQWPGFLPPVAGRMYDDLAHQRWVIDPTTGDLAYRNIDPFLDVEVRGTRQLYTTMVRQDDGNYIHVVGIHWMDIRGNWHSETWMNFAPMPPVSWLWK